ncbi:MAG: endonuclease/exonuclease/phosphatase family protein [Paracoccaceae bacterium]
MFRIASYNIRKSIGLDYRRDPSRVLGVVNSLGADIVALQEVDRRFGTRKSSIPARLLEGETDYFALDVATRDGSIGWHGNAILLRRGTTVTRVSRVDLPGLEPRGAVSADLDLATGPLRVVGVHLGLRSRDRRAQSAALAAHLEDLPKMPAIVLGDFNEWSQRGRNLTALHNLLDMHLPGRSYPTQRPVAQLDRIVHSRDLRVENSAVHHCKSAARASDHLPIWADMARA